MKQIKTLTLNGNTYEITDETARTQLDPLSAEMMNLRVDAVGFTHETAGDAVRFLDSTLLKKYNPCVLTKDSVFFQGYISGENFIEDVSGSNANQRTSDFIELEPGITYQCDYEGVKADGTIVTTPRVVAFYNSDKSYSRATSNASAMNILKLENNEKYIRVNTNNPQINILRVYPTGGSYEVTAKLNPSLEVPQAKKAVDALENTLLAKEDPCVLTEKSVFEEGGIAADGSVTTTGMGINQYTSDFIELEPDVTYQCDFEGLTSSGTVKNLARMIGFYHSDKSYSRAVSTASAMSLLKLQGDEKYIRVNYSAAKVNYLRVYPKHGGYETKITLNPRLEIPQVKELRANSGNYIHARRPVIAFIFDHDGDMNADMEEAFSRHNMRVGFAPQYTTNFENNSADTYRAWQAKGHEILVHGTYVLTGDTYTEEQAKAYIRASYETFTRYGFAIHGYIGSHGKVDEKYLPAIKQYFDYAATENNGAGDGAQSTFYFGTHNPYKLWRFGLQQSTISQCISAVDHAMETGGLLLFYGHARSTNNDYLTLANIETLLSHIEQVGATVKTPYAAIKDFFSVRYEDFLSAVKEA